METSIDHLVHQDSPREHVPREIAERYNAYRTDHDLLELVMRLADERGMEIPDPTEGDEAFTVATQKTLDFRQGKTREEIEGGDFSQATKDVVEKLIEKYGMRLNTEPKNPDVDAAIVLGAASITPLTRLEYLMDLMGQGKVNTSRIVMVGGERELKDPEIPKLLTRLGDPDADLSGKVLETEFDLMRETAARKFGIADDEWVYREGDDPNVPHEYGFKTTWRFAYANKDGREIYITSAPMMDEDRYSPFDGSPRDRANTIDSELFAARILQMGKADGGNFLQVTNSVFVPFQDADAKKALTGYGVNVETVGMNREYSGLGEWPGNETYYISEILAAIRSTRFANERLSKLGA